MQNRILFNELLKTQYYNLIAFLRLFCRQGRRKLLPQISLYNKSYVCLKINSFYSLKYPLAFIIDGYLFCFCLLCRQKYPFASAILRWNRWKSSVSEKFSLEEPSSFNKVSINRMVFTVCETYCDEFIVVG